MPDDNVNTFMNIGDFSKPINTFIKKISKAVGGAVAPWQIKRIATAKADASLIETHSEIEIQELKQRAMDRLLSEATLGQQNIEHILSKAIPLVSDASNANQMNDDWVANFFDKSKFASDNSMQEMWARALAGEANMPGSFSKRTVNALGDFDTFDCNCFASLCRFEVQSEFTEPLVINWPEEIYSGNGVDRESLIHLEGIGVIRMAKNKNYAMKLTDQLTIKYHNENIYLEPRNVGIPDELNVGCVMYTTIGRELSILCDDFPIDGFADYIRMRFRPLLASD